MEEESIVVFPQLLVLVLVYYWSTQVRDKAMNLGNAAAAAVVVHQAVAALNGQYFEVYRHSSGVLCVIE